MQKLKFSLQDFQCSNGKRQTEKIKDNGDKN